MVWCSLCHSLWACILILLFLGWNFAEKRETPEEVQILLILVPPRIVQECRKITCLSLCDCRESFALVKGAVLLLEGGEGEEHRGETSTVTSPVKSSGASNMRHRHLQAMIEQLRPEDTIQLVRTGVGLLVQRLSKDDLTTCEEKHKKYSRKHCFWKQKTTQTLNKYKHTHTHSLDCYCCS